MNERLRAGSMIARAAACLSLALLVVGMSEASAPSNDWTQWGGPHRNFKVESKGLAVSWPESGPRKLWSRPLGEGHSSIVVEGGRLYTMYRRGEQDVVIALDAASGKTVWEHAYDAPSAGMNYEAGKGPHSTPLIAGSFIYTVGSVGRLLCLDKQTGKPVWAQELWKDLKGTFDDRGYACSPLEYKDRIILTLGGKGQTLAAFSKKDGQVVWKKLDFMVSPSSHIIINVDGQDQMVAFLGKDIVGIDPNNGDLLWSHPHVTEYGLNISTPIWGEDNLLFVSSAYNGGSRVLKLERKQGRTSVTELWFHRRLRVHHGTAVRIGDYVYGSSGDFGPAFITAVDIKTGKEVFRDRGFPKTNLLYADGKLILLDEDGNLAIAAIVPEGMKVLAKASVLQNLAWTAPTLVGTTLYVRDRKTIVALDLGLGR